MSLKLLKFVGLLVVLLFAGCTSVTDALRYDGPDEAEERKIESQRQRVEDAKFPNTRVIGIGADVK